MTADLTPFGRLWDRLIPSRRVGPIVFHPFDSAMRGALQVSTRWGYLCLGWPRLGVRKSSGLYCRPAYVYLSPNATPWAATFLAGGDWSTSDRRMVRVRRALWGHGYDPDAHCATSLRDAIEWRFGGEADRAIHNGGAP